MNTVPWNDYRLSRMMLGTVQFGLPYGVANRTGQPDYRDVVKILAEALAGGVNCIDTAAAYGTSEEVLGRALRELDVAQQVVVVTKVRALTPLELANPILATQAIEDSVAESRRRLQLECLPVVLFHREADADYLNVLESLRERGWLRHAGVSCDNRPGAAAQFVAGGRASALQIPGNVLDHRHERSGVFQAAAAQGIAVFIRSVYLQGLLLMPEDDIPPPLRQVASVRHQLAAVADQAGISLSELAVRYMLSHAGVTCVLTGVETLAQVRENIAMFDRGSLPADLLADIAGAIPELPEWIITPSQWPPRDP